MGSGMGIPLVTHNYEKCKPKSITWANHGSLGGWD